MNIEVKVIQIIKEDAYCDAGNVGGMGDVVAPQPGILPGTTGTTGSGDVGFGLNSYTRPSSGMKKKKKKKRSKFTEVFDIKQNWTNGADKPPKIKSWNDFK